jgi:ABC-2 type transport system permease protein
MPDTLANIAKWMPSYRYAELGWSVLDKKAPSAGGVAILAGWVLICALLASVTYRRAAAKR